MGWDAAEAPCSRPSGHCRAGRRAPLGVDGWALIPFPPFVSMLAMSAVPEAIGIIAGKGVYPRLLAESARAQGVARLVAVAFKGETGADIESFVDETEWIYLGQMGALLDAFRRTGVKCAVMAGVITPTNLFKVRMDSKMMEVLKRLPAKNAHTIFGAVGDELAAIGVELLHASSFMQAHMPEAGTLTEREPTAEEKADIELGMQVAETTSALDIGQTVVVKQGTILAVEAFEGTDEAVRRAAKLGGKGIVITKVAKQGHDMRFDIPAVGMQTMKLLRRVKAGALAVQAGRAILLERERVIEEANRIGVAIVAVAPGSRT